MTVEPYSFHDAERIRYGRFPIMDTVLYRWARKIEETLFDKFRAELYAGASVVEEMKFSSFFASLKRPRPIYTFTMDPFQGEGLFVLDNRFASLCLGGPAKAAPAGTRLGPHNHRQLQAVVQAMMDDFDRCWADVLQVKTHLKKLTTYLFRARILNAHEPCFVAQIHLSGGQISSRLTWCFPRVMLESALARLSEPNIVPSLFPDRIPLPKGDPGQLIDQVPYTVGVTLGKVKIRIGGHELRVGNVLPVESEVGADAVVDVNGRPLLVGTVGEVEGRYAVRLTGSYAERLRQYRTEPGPFREIQWPEAD